MKKYLSNKVSYRFYTTQKTKRLYLGTVIEKTIYDADSTGKWHDTENNKKNPSVLQERKQHVPKGIILTNHHHR